MRILHVAPYFSPIYGGPCALEKMRQIVRLKPEGKFELDMDYFLCHPEGISMEWDDDEPKIGKVHSDRLVSFLGSVRTQG